MRFNYYLISIIAALVAAPSLAVNPPPSQPVSGTLAFTDVSTLAAGSDVVGTPTALGALNARASVALAGRGGCGYAMPASTTLVGTLTAEVSYDGGTTWSGTGVYFVGGLLPQAHSNTYVAASGVAVSTSIVFPGGPTHCSARVSAYTSGTGTATLRATTAAAQWSPFLGTAGNAGPPSTAQVGGQDGSGNTQPLGIATTGTTAPLTPLAVGGRSVDFSATSTSPQTAVAAGNGTRANFDSEGRLMVTTAHPRGIYSTGTTSATVQTQLFTAPSATLAYYITTLTVSSTAAAASGFTLSYGTGTNCATGNAAFWTALYPATPQPMHIPFAQQQNRIPANNNVCILDTGTGNKTIAAYGYLAP